MHFSWIKVQLVIWLGKFRAGKSRKSWGKTYYRYSKSKSSLAGWSSELPFRFIRIDFLPFKANGNKTIKHYHHLRCQKPLISFQFQSISGSRPFSKINMSPVPFVWANFHHFKLNHHITLFHFDYHLLNHLNVQCDVANRQMLDHSKIAFPFTRWNAVHICHRTIRHSFI